MPKVSVVMPTYNYGRYVYEAVSSVLMQTYKDLELIVVDDGSTDDTYAMLADIQNSRFHYIKQINQGVSAARNTGLNHAAGEYIAFLDADDIWRPDYLTRMVALLDREPDVDLAFADFARFGPDGPYTRTYLSWMPELASLRWRISGDARVILDDPFTTLVAFGEQPIQLQTIMIRAKRVGGMRFDTRFSLGEDRHYVLRAWLRSCGVAYIPKVLADVRRHDSNTYRVQAARPHAMLDLLTHRMTLGQRNALLHRIGQAYRGAGHQARKRKDWLGAARSYLKALQYPGRRLVFSLALLTLACSDPLSVGDKRAATPDEIDRNTSWYRNVAECLGQPGQPERVRWWYVTRIEHPDLGTHLIGVQRGHDIYVIPPAGPNLGSVEHHEAMHHILYTHFGTPDPNHTHPRWNPCAGVPITTEA